MWCNVGRCGRLAVVPLLLVGLCGSAQALEPDEVALVVNRQVPEGRRLAELYARRRHVPDGRIIEVDVHAGLEQNPAEEMPFEAYEPRVAAPVRDYLQSRQLQAKVKCLVTFWGMPLRIGRRALTLPQNREMAALKKELEDVKASIAQQVGMIEASAVRLDGTFKPQAGTEVAQLFARLDAALISLTRSLPHLQDGAERDVRFLQAISATERLMGSARMTIVMSQPAVAAVAPRPPTRRDVDEARRKLAEGEQEIARSQSYAPTGDQLSTTRALAGKYLGLFGTAAFLSSQVESFRTQETESALDSELALLWWKQYPRARWLVNPLYWRTRQQRLVPPFPTVMVTRLDGPTVQDVENIIATSINVERDGLSGQVVIDARGRPASDPYGQYDQGLRELNGLLAAKTKLKVSFDDQEALIPPHSLTDSIALYCGWYSLRSYAPPGSFSAGAVGFHVASFELISLRGRGERGWVRGLLSDGVVATLGPVAEPYLQSFPRAEEFFPLLLTGKMPLAEVYWRTVPSASWMQACIGDPLYTPYQHNPPLRAQDLPAGLREALDPPN